MSSLSSKIDTHDKGIKSALATSQDTITNAIIGVNNHITTECTTLEDKIDTKGCVKSIQIDNFTFSNNFYSDRTIKAVDPKKSIIITEFACNDTNGFCYCEFQSSTAYKCFIGGCGIGPTFNVHTTILEFY